MVNNGDDAKQMRASPPFCSSVRLPNGRRNSGGISNQLDTLENMSEVTSLLRSDETYHPTTSKVGAW